MAEKKKTQKDDSTRTVTTTGKEEKSRPNQSIRLKLTISDESGEDRRVKWHEKTIDNEFMNKKKSKCCCIYEKPRKFTTDSSEEEQSDDCDEDCDDEKCTPHCHGHGRKDFVQKPTDGSDSKRPSSPGNPR